MTKIVFIAETIFDGDIFIRSNPCFGCHNSAASVQIWTEKNARGPGIQTGQA